MSYFVSAVDKERQFPVQAVVVGDEMALEVDAQLMVEATDKLQNVIRTWISTLLDPRASEASHYSTGFGVNMSPYCLKHDLLQVAAGAYDQKSCEPHALFIGKVVVCVTYLCDEQA